MYLYSQFEVPDSRRVFAVFEQPDLKATFQFTVTAPEPWKVVSNSPTPEPKRHGDGTATWRFEPTPRISSYITALIAGPYEQITSELTSSSGRVIPLGVFARKSLWQHLDADYVFDITRKGFAYFEEKFGYPYPFAKYDQLFVPEFNAGAMENAGAVTFTETYVFRSKVTDAVKERRVVTILHELAHMWFGDLVTMKWWNDLWLNESFAEWASTIATAEATEWTEAWTTFNAMEKTWAYRQDQLPSTHPVVAQINDLEDVQVNFDGITYAKGGSVLKQLAAWVGIEAFFAGVAAYFKKHEWSNTELSDLLTELETTSGRELATWSKKWLETAGVNTLSPEIATDASGVITRFAIVQTAPADYPTIRPHRLGVGFYSLQGDALVRVHRVELDVDGDLTEVPELKGQQRPDLVLLNDEDLAYAKIRLDERSLATAIEHLGEDQRPPRALARVGCRVGSDTGCRDLAERVHRPRAAQHRRRDRVDDRAHDPRAAAARRELVRRAREARRRAREGRRRAVGARQRRRAGQRQPAPARDGLRQRGLDRRAVGARAPGPRRRDRLRRARDRHRPVVAAARLARRRRGDRRGRHRRGPRRRQHREGRRVRRAGEGGAPDRSRRSRRRGRRSSTATTCRTRSCGRRRSASCTPRASSCWATSSSRTSTCCFRSGTRAATRSRST